MNNCYLKIGIVIADDHEIVREGLRTIIGTIEDIEIIGEAANGEELIQMVRRVRPDVVLADVKMPKCSGIEATKVIKQEFPHIGIVALSSYDEENLVMDMLNAGAKAYLLKNASKAELTDAIKAAYRDESFYCKEINHKLAQMVARGGLFSESKKQKPLFSERELEVIKQICQEKSSKQIAYTLNLKPRTIERYRDMIMEKMEVQNVAGLVIYALTMGLYSPPTGKK